MTSSIGAIELYGKQFTSCEFVLATNENHTKKLVWYEKYSQKCCLANVAPTSGEPHLYKMKMQLSRDEILELSDRLAKVKKGNDVNELLSEGEDYLQKPTCHVIQTIKAMIARSTTTLNQGQKYIQNLQTIVERYNESPHRALYNLSPYDVQTRIYIITLFRID